MISPLCNRLPSGAPYGSAIGRFLGRPILEAVAVGFGQGQGLLPRFDVLGAQVWALRFQQLAVALDPVAQHGGRGLVLGAEEKDWFVLRNEVLFARGIGVAGVLNALVVRTGVNHGVDWGWGWGGGCGSEAANSWRHAAICRAFCRRSNASHHAWRATAIGG